MLKYNIVLCVPIFAAFQAVKLKESQFEYRCSSDSTRVDNPRRHRNRKLLEKASFTDFSRPLVIPSLSDFPRSNNQSNCRDGLRDLISYLARLNLNEEKW